MRKIIIGSRESALAVAQTKMLQNYIEENCPDISAEILTMKTTGDRILEKRLDEVGGKGLFVKELELALLEERVQLCVHSLKDMPMETREELPILGYSKREDPRDVLVLPEGAKEINLSLPIGTSSLRRELQLKKLYPEAKVEMIRGNLLSRLRKLEEGRYGVLVLAAAGLKRLGLAHRIFRYFSVEEILPAAGQGILAVQGKKGFDYGFLAGFFDEGATDAAIAERSFVKRLGGGCSSPVAAYAEITEDKLMLTGLTLLEEKEMKNAGQEFGEGSPAAYRIGKIQGKRSDGGRLGEELAERMRGMKDSGKVWLVGAGPAEIDLLTIKAKKVIEQADVVVHDALVGRSIVDIIPDSVEKIDVGKRAGRFYMPQEEINALLPSLARQGKKVVRLKGGDPFVFGRGGEEMDALVENGIPFEVVPGVTSAIAVPAYFGIPATHREFASSVHIITGHPKKGEELRINYPALKEAGGTLVFLMGILHLHPIVSGLLTAGMEPKTPAAILQQGGSGGQKKISTTLDLLEEEAGKQEILMPAIIIVGEVVRLSEKYAWLEKLPLFGKKFLTTRPRERSGELAERLRELGAKVVELPTIEIEGIHPNLRLREEIARLSAYRFLAFTSPAGVEAWMRELFDMGKDARFMSGVSIAAIGSGTAQALRRYGLLADLVPEVYHGKALGALLREKCADGDKVLLARSAIGNPELVEELKKGKEIEVTDIAVYITKEKDGVGDCPVEEADGVFFTSSSTVRGFGSLFSGMDFSGVRALCIGEMTARTAKEYGMQAEIAEEATVEGLVELACGQAGEK